MDDFVSLSDAELLQLAEQLQAEADTLRARRVAVADERRRRQAAHAAEVAALEARLAALRGAPEPGSVTAPGAVIEASGGVA